MTIQKIRSVLYALAKYLGDAQALQQQARGKDGAIRRRIARRATGYVTGRLLGRLFRG